MRAGGEKRVKASPRASLPHQEHPSRSWVSGCLRGLSWRSRGKEVELGALEKVSLPSAPGGRSGGNGKGRTSGQARAQRPYSPAPPAVWASALSSGTPSAAPAAPWGREQRAARLASGWPPLLPRSNLRWRLPPTPSCEQPGQHDPEASGAQGRRSTVPPAGHLQPVPEPRSVLVRTLLCPRGAPPRAPPSLVSAPALAPPRSSASRWGRRQPGASVGDALAPPALGPRPRAK